MRHIISEFKNGISSRITWRLPSLRYGIPSENYSPIQKCIVEWINRRGADLGNENDLYDAYAMNPLQLPKLELNSDHIINCP